MPVSDHEVTIEAHDSIVRISLVGATVFSWISLGMERFFLSSKSSASGPAALRGGIPIVWPVFGPPPKEAPFNKLKQHGFARSAQWELARKTSTSAHFELKPIKDIKSLYDPDFELAYDVEIVSATSIRTTLHVYNPGSEALRFQALLHNYFLLPAGATLKDVALSPVKGLTYKNKPTGGNEIKEEAEAATISGETDRVYASTSEHNRLSCGSRGAIKIAKSNLPDTVFWNPDKEKSDAIGDMEPAGFERFVCVEPGHVSSFVELEPKGTIASRLIEAPAGESLRWAYGLTGYAVRALEPVYNVNNALNIYCA